MLLHQRENPADQKQKHSKSICEQWPLSVKQAAR